MNPLAPVSITIILAPRLDSRLKLTRTGATRACYTDAWSVTAASSNTCSSSMLEKLKQNWHKFEEGTPGERFQQRFKRRHRSGQGVWRKALFIGGGLLIMTAGVFMLVAPGPGLLAIFIGAGVIAQESLFAARVLDWTELRLRKLLAWSLGLWRRAPRAAKILLVLCAVAIAVAFAYAAYMLLFAK